MVRKFIASLLAIGMVVSAAGFTVFAEGDTGVTTEEALRAALASGGNIKLSNNIELTESLTIPTDMTVLIDLNTYSLSTENVSDPGAVTIFNYGELTLKNGGIVSSRHGISSFSPAVLNAENVTITANKTRMVTDEETGDEYTQTYNGIWNSGSLTVTGCTVTGSNNAINNVGGTAVIKGGTYTGSGWDGIYNYTGNVTIEDGAVIGYNNAIQNEGGSVTVNGGSVTVANETYYCIDSYNIEDENGSEYTASLTLGGGTFNAVLNIEPGSALTVTSSNPLRFTKVRMQGPIPENIAYDSLSLIGTITEGEYSNVTGTSATFPAGSTAKVHFVNAALAGTVKAGTFDGIVKSANLSKVTGGTFSKELKESIDALNLSSNSCLQAGYRFVENTDGSFTVKNVGTASFTIKAANTTGGYLTVAGVKLSGSKTFDGTTSAEFTKSGITKGSDVEFYATAVARENYTFTGWYTNVDGSGTPVYTDAALGSSSNYIRYTLNEDTTLYAVFKSNEEYQKVIDGVNTWLTSGQETNSYTVSSTDDMYKFAYAVNILGNTFSGATVTLNADLTYTSGSLFMPIGTDAHKFTGTFDGGNKTIKNLTYTVTDGGLAGIFGYSTGTIKNLNVDNCSFTTAGDVGGIAAWAEGTIENCSVTGCTISGGYRYTGGIVGHTYGMTMISVTSTNNTITGTFKAGGVVGYADGLQATNVTATGNTFIQTETSSGSAGAYGALCGHMNAGSSVLTDSTVTDAAHSLIAQTYGSAGSLTISETDGGTTAITAASIAGDVSSEITLTGGTYTLGAVTTAASFSGTVTITGGTYVQSDGTTPLEEARAYVETGFTTDDKGTVVKGLIISTGGAIAKYGENEPENGKTEATGFVTYIKGNNMNKIKWQVTSGGVTKSTNEYELGTITGEARVGIIINGLYDAGATAKAAVQTSDGASYTEGSSTSAGTQTSEGSGSNN